MAPLNYLRTLERVTFSKLPFLTFVAMVVTSQLSGCFNGDLDVSYLESTGSLSIQGSNQVTVGTCASYSISYHDSNVTNPSENSSSATVSLIGPVQFYSDSACRFPIAHLDFIPQKESAKFYLKNTRKEKAYIQTSLPNGTMGSLEVNFLEGPADHFRIIHDPGYGEAGKSLELIIQVVDRYENPVGGASLNFSILIGNASVQTPTAITDAYGMARGIFNLPSTITHNHNVISISGTSAFPNIAGTGYTSIILSETVYASAPDHIVITTNPGMGIVGSSLTLGVRVLDRFENPVQGVPLNFDLTSGSGSLSSSSVSSDFGGYAYSNLNLGTLATNTPTVVTVSSSQFLPNLAGTGSSTAVFSELVFPGPASPTFSTLTLSPSGPVISGSTVQVTFALKDQYANPISGELPQLISSVPSTVITQALSPSDNTGLTTASFVATQAPSHDIRVISPSSISSLQTSIAVTSQSPTSIAFTSTPLGGPVGSCQMVAIEARNNSGTPSPLGTTQSFTLSTNSLFTTFYSDSSCTTQSSTFSILAGQTSYIFSYRDMSAEFLNFTITPDAGAISGVLNGGAPSTVHLSIIPPASSSTANTCLGPFSVTSPSVISPSTVTPVDLSYDSAAGATYSFYADPSCNTSITKVFIQANTTVDYFYFRTNLAENGTISAAIPSNLTSALFFLSTDLSYPITAQLTFSLPPPGTGPVMTCIGPVTVEAPQVLSQSSPTSVNLTYTSQFNADFGYYSEATCGAGNKITSTSIPSQQTTSSPFYFKTDRVETGSLRATLSPLNSLISDGVVSYTFSVLNAISKILITGPSFVTHNSCVPLSLVAADAGNNILNLSSNSTPIPLTLSGLTNSFSEIFTDPTCTTSANNSATVPIYTSKITLYLKPVGLTTAVQTLSASTGPITGSYSFKVTSTSILRKVSVGAKHVCGIARSNIGGVDEEYFKCLGANLSGQLGTGDTRDLLSPSAPLVGGISMTQISSGSDHTCSVGSNGNVYCWGKNYSLNPTQVAAISGNAVDVAAGKSHTCARISDGASSYGVSCWGDNQFGQLGEGSTTNASSPTPVSGLSTGVYSIVTGNEFTCAIVNSGIKCWGQNLYGQLGNLLTSNSSTPTTVTGLASSTISNIAAGGSFACAVVTNPGITGGVMCWGKNDPAGGGANLGDGGTASGTACSPYCSYPVYVLDSNTGVSLSGAISVAAGLNHACALLNTGEVKCWGSSNNFGEIGDNSTLPRASAVSVSQLSSGVQSISSNPNGHTTCAVKTDGAVACWGLNDAGQLGIGGYLSLFGNFSIDPLFAGSLISP